MRVSSFSLFFPSFPSCDDASRVSPLYERGQSLDWRMRRGAGVVDSDSPPNGDAWRRRKVLRKNGFFSFSQTWKNYDLD